MKWLKRKVIKWGREFEEQADPPGVADGDSWSVSGQKASGRLKNAVTPRSDPAVSFRLYSATNGQVLEFTKYDPRTDRNDISIYIIDKDKDVGEFVSKCVNLEMLK
jgi:hypothetical protein